MTPTNMGYSEIELPEVSSQHHLAALMLASLSTRHILSIIFRNFSFLPQEGPQAPQGVEYTGSPTALSSILNYSIFIKNGAFIQM